MDKGIIIGIIISIAISGLILIYTNFFDIIKPEIESSMKIAENTTLGINGKNNVGKTGEVTDKNMTSDFSEIKNIREPETEFKQVKLSGIAYSPYRKDQSPLTDLHPSLDEIENDMKLLSSVTDRIRIYGIVGNNQFIPEIAQKYGLKTAVTLLLTGDETDYDKIEKAVQMANKHNGIYTIIVENEGLYRDTLSEEQIIKYVDKTREKLDPTYTVTIAEPVGDWFDHPEIAKHVDYVLIHNYPYFNGVDISDAANTVFDEYKNVKKAFGKDVVIGETNWPSSGKTIKLAIPSPENQQKFISEFKKIADFNEIKYYIFEAFDEKWKVGEQFDPEGLDVEKHWGLFFENGTIKKHLKNTILPIQNITTRN